MQRDLENELKYSQMKAVRSQVITGLLGRVHFDLPATAIAHADALARAAARIIDIGAASSNPDAKPVPPETEIARLAAVIPALRKKGLSLSIDSFTPEVQRWAVAQGADYLNDIHGFPDPALYPELASSPAKFIVR